MPRHHPTLAAEQRVWDIFEYPRVHCIKNPAFPSLHGAHIPLLSADTFFQLQCIPPTTKRCIVWFVFASFVRVARDHSGRESPELQGTGQLAQV
jgi:hypothetical protein